LTFLCGVLSSIERLWQESEAAVLGIEKRKETLIPSSFWREESSAALTAYEDEIRFVKRVTDFEQLDAKLS